MEEVTSRLFMVDIVAIEFLALYHLLVINYYFSSARMTHVQREDLKCFGMERQKVIKDTVGKKSLLRGINKAIQIQVTYFKVGDISYLVIDKFIAISKKKELRKKLSKFL